ncbi:unnamed protein product [Penicillium olsonii]|nr:unnamed protein product [Penicillium olsonii]
MSTSTTTVTAATPSIGSRKNGKNWHGTKKAFRPNAGLTSYAKRQEARKHADAVKELEREMKAEHEAERKDMTVSPAHIQRIKDRREAKEEKLRYEKMAEKMHHKRVERLKRREKRNKLLNS